MAVQGGGNVDVTLLYSYEQEKQASLKSTTKRLDPTYGTPSSIY